MIVKFDSSEIESLVKKLLSLLRHSMHENDWKALEHYLVPSAVIRSVYRGKLQSFIKAAFDEGELILPPTLSVSQFWAMYQGLYKKTLVCTN